MLWYHTSTWTTRQANLTKNGGVNSVFSQNIHVSLLARGCVHAVPCSEASVDSFESLTSPF